MGRTTLLSLAGIATALFLSACQTSGTTPSPASVMTPPPGAPLAEYNPPPVGTVWTYHHVARDGAESELEAERIEDGIFEGRKVMRVSVLPNTELHDAPTGNWFATLGADGKLIKSATPYNDELNFPLFEGKKWIATMKWEDHARGRTWNEVQTFWEVEGQETITVPAGTFETWRLQSKPGKSNAVTKTAWYAPELGILVKRRAVYGKTHYLGSGTAIRELVDYQRPAA